MRKYCLLLLLIFSYNPLLAQSFKNFNLDAYIARHRIAGTFDPISRCFTSSDKLQKRITAKSEQLAAVEQKLAELARLQTADTSKALNASAPFSEDDFWEQNRLRVMQERELKTEKFALINEKTELSQLLSRDSRIVPDINDLMADIRAEFSEQAVYINYLPAPAGVINENWLSSPLQIYLWSRQERHLNEYLDNAYNISLIFPESRRPVVYQKGDK